MIKLVDDSGTAPSLMEGARSRLRSLSLVERHGRVVQMIGLVIESRGPMSAIGDICQIESASSSEGVAGGGGGVSKRKPVVDAAG